MVADEDLEEDSACFLRQNRIAALIFGNQKTLLQFRKLTKEAFYSFTRRKQIDTEAEETQPVCWCQVSVTFIIARHAVARREAKARRGFPIKADGQTVALWILQEGEVELNVKAIRTYPR